MESLSLSLSLPSPQQGYDVEQAALGQGGRWGSAHVDAAAAPRRQRDIGWDIGAVDVPNEVVRARPGVARFRLGGGAGYLVLIFSMGFVHYRVELDSLYP